MKADNLNIIVFCGGVGTRLWPLSRQSLPKQFQPIVGRRTLLQNTIYDRLRPDFAWERIYISTGLRYLNQVKKQLPKLPKENFLLEPEMRDTGPAVGLAVLRVMTRHPGEPVAVLWQDHLVKDLKLFKRVLVKAARLVSSGQKPMVFLGTPSRYPNVNLGYIEIGETLASTDGLAVSTFTKFTEKPDREKARQFCQGGKHLWNPGYFVCDPKFLLQKFKDQRQNFDIYDKLATIQKALGTDQEEAVIGQVFPTINQVAVDYVVHENVKPDEALVVWADYGWSDVGEWRALKEALEKDPRENIVRGKQISLDSEGCLFYSFTDRLVATVGLREMIVVDTDDVVLVCPADRASDVKKLVKKLKAEKREEYL